MKLGGTTLVMIAAYVAAIVWALYEWQGRASPPEVVATETEVEMPELSDAGRVLNQLQRYSQFVDRPPFLSTRRAPSEEEPETPQVAIPVAPPPRADASQLRLTAVIVDGDRRTALVEHMNGTLFRAMEGTRIENWKVDSVSDDQIQLEANGQQATLMVHRFDEAPPPMSRRPPAPPGVLRIPPRRQQMERRQPDAAEQAMQQQNFENEEPPQ
jgi:hypothetical protein